MERSTAVSRVKRTGVRFPVLLDEKGDTFRPWSGSVCPTSLVLDRGGRTRYVPYGPLEWDSEEVEETLKSLIPTRQAAGG